MKILLDTHLLVWALEGNLPPKAKQYIEDENNTLQFSPISIYEIVIKNRKRLPDFCFDPAFFYSELIRVGYIELPLTSHHSLLVRDIPLLHKDPFDRILLAQAQFEGIQLLTSDNILAKYPEAVIFVG